MPHGPIPLARDPHRRALSTQPVGQATDLGRRPRAVDPFEHDEPSRFGCHQGEAIAQVSSRSKGQTGRGGYRPPA